jgi:hypothetical protein
MTCDKQQQPVAANIDNNFVHNDNQQSHLSPSNHQMRAHPVLAR